MTRDEAIATIRHAMPGGFYAHGIDEHTKRVAAERAWDALSGFVVFRSELEQVGEDVFGRAVYRIREAREEEQ